MYLTKDKDLTKSVLTKSENATDPEPKEVTVMEQNHLTYLPYKNLIEQCVVNCPEGRLYGWAVTDINPFHRIAVKDAAEAEVEKSGMEYWDALNMIRGLVVQQVDAIPLDQLRFMGSVEKYFNGRRYRAEATQLTGGGNGNGAFKNKGQRTADVFREFLTDLNREGANADADASGGTTLEGIAEPVHKRLA